MSNGVDVIFCGLVREEHLFKKSLKDFVSMRNKGIIEKIIFSTWIGEIDKHPGIRKILEKSKVLVIESEEPKVAGVGSIWNQMKSFDISLKKSKKNNFILKTRTDVYVNPAFLKKIFNNPEENFKITKELPGGNILKYKVWVPWYEITRPFYMADEVFFGYYDDVKKLINYDGSYDKEYSIGPGIAHIRRFIHPFINKYPVLKKSLGKYSPDSFLKRTLRKISEKKFDIRKLKIVQKMYKYYNLRNLHKKLDNPEFLNCLAVYYIILNSHFIVDSRSTENQVTFRDYNKAKEPIKGGNAERYFFRGRDEATTHEYDLDFVKLACEQRLDKTPIGIKLMNAIRSVSG